jgi:dTDP-4-amino-4,6-dideoxygalactose transaminase
MSKLENIHKIRERNYRLFLENLPSDMWKPTSHGFTSNFAYPMIDKNRSKITISLEARGVETRPLICGDMQTQPYIKELFPLGGRVKNAKLVDDFGFYVPNHTMVCEQDVYDICDIITRSCQ